MSQKIDIRLSSGEKQIFKVDADFSDPEILRQHVLSQTKASTVLVECIRPMVDQVAEAA